LVLAFGAIGVATAALLAVVYSDRISSDLFGQESLVYYWSPTELGDAGDVAQKATVRLGGVVRRGDDPDWDKKLPLEFYVEDAGNKVLVRSTGAPPQMFREGIGVVVEGRLNGDVFETDRVMVKHSNEYRVPEDGDVESAMKTMDGV
jgi:cytochrome c-type biogenesis protein CcmE